MPKLFDFKAKADQRFSIRAAKDKKSAEIVIYDIIGPASFWMDTISAKQFSEELGKLDKDIEVLNVRINSPGGDCFDGMTIYNRLKQHKAKKIVHIDGLAASMASIIACAGDEIIMGEGALYMIHLPWCGVYGNRMDLDNAIARLMDIEEQMIGIYSRKSGLDRTEIRAMMEAETWMDADATMKNGFADSKAEDALPIAASAFDMPWVKKAPKGFKSEKAAIETGIEKFKKELKETIARK